MKNILFILVGILLVQCAPTSRLSEIYKSYNPIDYLYWSEDIKLTWNDFQGLPIDTPNLNSESYFQNPSSVSKQNLFSTTDVVVATIFDRKSSWVIREKVTDKGLLYHQVLFDIFELYSRKFRKEITEQDDILGDFTSKFHELGEKNNRLLIEEAQRYRSETKSGLNYDAVKLWEKTIRKELRVLDKYKMNYNN